MQTLRRVDKNRFKELAYPHLQFLYNVALKYSGKPYEAEDLVQETMYTAYKKIHQLRDDKKCRSWLFMILRSHFLKEKRQVVKRPYLDDGDGYLKHAVSDSATSIPDSYEKKMNKETVHRALMMIPEKYRSSLILYYMEEMTYQEISEYLDIPIGTVMSRLARGKKYMKNELLKGMQSGTAAHKIIPITGLLG